MEHTLNSYLFQDLLVQDSRCSGTTSNLTISAAQEEAGLDLNPERLIISSVLFPQTITSSPFVGTGRPGERQDGTI